MAIETGLLIVSFFAFLQDIWMHKVKNWYILLMLFMGIAYHSLSGNVIASILGVAAGMLFYPLFALRLMGAGDVKMFCVLGAWATIACIFMVMAYCVLANGVVALAIMLMRKNGKAAFYNLWLWLKMCFIARGYVPMAEEMDGSDKYPYMTGVFLGVIVFCFLGG